MFARNEKIYPDIVWRSNVYEKDGKYCVRVEVEYSGDTPHFGGIAWIRRGNATIKAPDEVFQRLIELRSETVRELSKWIGKEILMEADEGQFPPALSGMGQNPRWPRGEFVTLLFVNRYWMTFQKGSLRLSEPLAKVTLSFNNQRSCLSVLVKR